jgi:Rieske Fe-S protein
MDRVNRRDFLAKSALTAASMAGLSAIAGCGDGQIGPPLPMTNASDPTLPAGGPVTVKLSDFPALATAGTLVAIDTERAVMRTGDSTFVGLSMICTHEQCLTSISSTGFDCPCHGSRYDTSGSVLNGPAARPLHPLTVAYDPAAGTITVD